MGGEITWQCLGNGNYRFIMKLYRECDGIIYPNTIPMVVTNYQGLSSIAMHLKPGGNPHDIDDGILDGITDISPNCWDTAQEIHCFPSPSSSNTGAVQEWYYTSDSIFPNGVHLTGVPPAAGWIFSYTSCCRNPCSNLGPNPSSMSWFLRAIMYPYNSTDAFPCFDSSPVFAESAEPVMCSGAAYLFCNIANDPDYDLLSYDWAPALDGNISTPVLYVSPYTYNSPLPGPAQNPLNVAATMDHNNGDISFTSYTNGAFVMVTKVTETRNGIKIGEIFKEVQLIILGCSGSNAAPVVEAPFYNSSSGLMGYSDTVNIGDTVDFDLIIVDNDTLPNGVNQSIILNAYGNDFGTGFTDQNTGCPNPPCATLNPPPIFSGMLSVATHFHWQTDSSHLTNIVSDSNFAYSRHDFYIQAIDNWCPIPGSNFKNVSVVIRAPIMKAPDFNCISVDTANHVLLSWDLPGGNPLDFSCYYIYRSKNNGTFTLIDTITNYYITDYIDSVANQPLDQISYYMVTKSGNNGMFTSQNSPQIKKIVSEVTDVGSNYVYIDWNTHRLSFSGKYLIYRAENNGQFVLIDSTTNTNYNDIVTVAGNSYQYLMEAVDTNLCTSWSSISSTTDWYGIQTNELKHKISVFPNPADDQLYLNILSGEVQTADVIICNSLGIEVRHDIFALAQDKNEVKIPTGTLSQGLYIIKVQAKDINEFFKIIILH
jgi:hypothetical protein